MSTGPDITKGFQNVTQTGQSEFFFQFLDSADALEEVEAIRATMRERLAVTPGKRFLDIGSGLGNEALRIAELVAPGGSVVGVDKSEMLITEAQRRASQADLPVEFIVGDAQQLDLPDSSFDGARAERVFMYLPDPEQALREMIRVVRPGGRISMFEFDNDGMLIDTPTPDLRDITRRLVRFNSESLPSGPIGSQLPRLFRKAGLVDVTAQPFGAAPPLWLLRKALGGTYEQAVVAGVVTAEELAAFWAYQEQADARGDLFGMYAGFIISGRKA